MLPDVSEMARNIKTRNNETIMKLAIISDIHENFHNLVLALEEIEKRKCSQIICLGDLMNTGIAKVLAKAPIPVLCLWGNNG
jgi:uncharacterized protein